MIRKSIILLFCLSIHFGGAAQHTVLLKDAQALLKVGKQIAFLEDKEGKLTIKEILQLSRQQRFVQHTKDIFKRPASGTVYWIRLKVDNQLREDAWLIAGDSRCWYLDFYAPNASGEYSDAAKTLGAMRPLPKNRLSDKFHCIRLAQTKNNKPKVYYLRIAGKFHINQKFQIGSASAVIRKLNTFHNVLALFMGVMLSMLVYNLFLYFSTRDSIYLIYVGYLTMVMVSHPFNSGQALFFQEWFWHYSLVWQAPLLLLMTLFVDRYLELVKNARRMRVWLWGLTFILAGVFPVLNLSTNVALWLSRYQTVLLCYTFSLLICGFYLLFRGIKTARFYVLGWSSVVVSSFVFVLVRNGNSLLPLNILTEHALYFGFGMEALLFSLALGDRLNTLKKDKELVEAKHLRFITKQKDILEEKIVQRTRQIEQINQSLSLTTSSAGIGTWSYSQQTNRIVWDEQMYRLHDNDTKSFEGSIKAWMRYIHPEDLGKVKNAFRQQSQPNKAFNVDFRIITPQQIRWIRLSAIFRQVPNEHMPDISGTSRDITDIKEANEKLKNNNVLLDSINYIQNEFIASTNSSVVFDFLLSKLLEITHSEYGFIGEVLYTEQNKPYLRAFAITQQFYGTSQHQREEFFIPEALFEGVLLNQQPLLINNLPGYLKEKNLPPEGYPPMNSFYGIPLLVHDTIIGMAGIANNPGGYHENVLDELAPLLSTTARLISAYKKEKERQELIEQLKKTTIAAEQASNAKSEFLANMSHEIRTPLNGVIGFTDLLLKTGLDNTQGRYLNIVNQSANTLLAIINDILDFSKIEAAKMELQPAKTDIIILLQGITDLVSYQARQQSLRVFLEVDQNLPRFVWIDETRLKQVLVNLLSNAVKFTEEGEVELKVEVTDQPTKEEVLVKFSVRDTGIGIAPENQQKIFEAFSQEDGSVNKRFGGTGLGLAISNKLLHLMHSKLELESKQGAGSVFSFMVGLKSQPEQAIVWTGIRNLKKILAISNHKQRLQNIASIAKAGNIEVVPALNGIKALETLQEELTYDAILIDQQMVFMDGLQTAHNIREAFPNIDCPLLLLHNEAEDSALEEACIRLHLLPQFADNTISETQLYEALGKAGEYIQSTRQNQNDPVLDEALVKVLIVDDNEINMMLAHEIIKAEVPSVKIFEAFSGEDAVLLYENEWPDVVLMDIQMSGMNGYETTLRIRETEEKYQHPRAKIIAVTAGVLKEEKEKCLKAGMDGYISKPVKIANIRSVFS